MAPVATRNGPSRKKTKNPNCTRMDKLHLYAGGNIGNTYNDFSDEGNDGHPLYKQIACYYSGVATRGSAFRRKIRNVVPGEAIDTIIAEVEEDLKEIYKDGDKLFVFGFSRGAATARLFVSDLNKYQVSPIRVAFLGLYDTVLQSPFKYGTSTSIFNMDIHDKKSSKLPTIVEKAVHFVAIDEHRYNFQPTLLNKDSRVKEIWVPGCHSDCGGGYYHDGISDAVLECMKMEAKEAGLKFASSVR